MNTRDFAFIIRLANQLFAPNLKLNEEQLETWEKHLFPYDREETETAIRERLGASRFLSIDELLQQLRAARKNARASSHLQRKNAIEKQQAELQRLVDDEAEMERHVRQLPIAEVERWRRDILANEPAATFMARLPMFSPLWISIIHARAVEGVAYVFDAQGNPETIPVAEYWERLRTGSTARATIEKSTRPIAMKKPVELPITNLANIAQRVAGGLP